MSGPRRKGAGLGLGLLLAGFGAWAANPQPAAPRFDHAKHLKLFPGSCTTCHLGAADAAAAFWPTSQSCRACHDGEVEKVVDWRPPTSAPPSNLRFTHPAHLRATADSVSCLQCHTRASRESGALVVRRLVDQCIACHQPGKPHLAVPDAQCATCHVPLAQALALPRETVAEFPFPDSHRAADFALGGHGKQAEATDSLGRQTVAASCATCHARDFCANCHVNAPEVPAIRSLARDERSLAHRFRFAAPSSHAAGNFLAAHGRQAKRDPGSCAACHAQPSCATCHVGPALPAPVAALPAPGPGRAAGARLERRPPTSHVHSFREEHGRQASAAPRSCATCHLPTDCLTCHRGNAAQSASAGVGPKPRSGGGDYHPAGFLVRHPSAAYARQTACADCHNTQQFCVSCHAQAGLGARRSLGSSAFHDGRAAFIVGHGQAARQSLESCVSCHVERDCTACHSSVGRGFRFSPHGPGFDPVRLRRRNPELCIACHGLAIPGAP